MRCELMNLCKPSAKTCALSKLASANALLRSMLDIRRADQKNVTSTDILQDILEAVVVCIHAVVRRLQGSDQLRSQDVGSHRGSVMTATSGAQLGPKRYQVCRTRL
jgi:hypothetical protein